MSIKLDIKNTRKADVLLSYSYLKLSIGFNFAAFIAGITPDANPTTTATVTDTTTGHALNGTLYPRTNLPIPCDKPTPSNKPAIEPIKDIKIEQQSDGTYKATILIPDTLKYNGMTSSTELTGIKSPEDLDNLVTEAMQNLYTGGSENPFAAKAAEGEE